MVLEGTPTIVCQGELAVRLRRRDRNVRFCRSSVLPSGLDATAFRTARNRACCTHIMPPERLRLQWCRTSTTGFDMRTRTNSLPTPNPRHASHNRPVRLGAARAERGMTCSAASMPLPTALCTPLMRGIDKTAAAAPISARPRSSAAGTAWITTLGDGPRRRSRAAAAFEQGADRGMRLERWNSVNGDRYGSS